LKRSRPSFRLVGNEFFSLEWWGHLDSTQELNWGSVFRWVLMRTLFLAVCLWFTGFWF
jgi:hypothetical protein